MITAPQQLQYKTKEDENKNNNRMENLLWRVTNETIFSGYRIFSLVWLEVFFSSWLFVPAALLVWPGPCLTNCASTTKHIRAVWSCNGTRVNGKCNVRRGGGKPPKTDSIRESNRNICGCVQRAKGKLSRKLCFVQVSGKKNKLDSVL